MLIAFCAIAYGQTKVVSGQVRDEKGEGVPFATVTEKGTKNAVQADANGLFQIKISDKASLVLSATGFESTTVTPGDGFFTTSLKAKSGELSEVVVTTALGIKRAPKSIGYSTATVNSEQITSGKSFNLGQALTNKVSGLTVYNTSASVNATPRITLRGLRSITGDNTALIVLDGVPVPSNTINYINPNDVESVSVMKGGQAATLFGSGSAYGADMNENFHPAENQQYGPAFDGSERVLGRVLQDGRYLLLPYAPIKGVRDDLWDTGLSTQSDISYRSGDETSSFLASYQNLYSNGIVYGDKYWRNSLRLNSSRTYGKVKVGFDATYTFDKSDRTNSDFYFFAINQSAWAPIDQLRDWRNNKFADPSGYFNDYYNNPWWQMDNNRFSTRNNYFNGNINATFKANTNLDFTARFGIANTQTNQQVTSNPYTYNGWSTNTSGAYISHYNRDYDFFLTNGGIFRARSTPIPGGLTESYSNGNRLNGDIFGTYKKTLGKVSLNTILGGNVQVRTSKNISANTAALGIPDLFNLNNSLTGLYTASDSKTELRKWGSYLDVTGGLNNNIYLHGVARYDQSSVFYLTDRDPSLYGFFTFGGDIAVILTDLIPSIKNKVLSFAKVHASWNKNTNDNVAAHSLEPLFLNAQGYPYSGLLGTTVSNTAINPNLTAEKVKTAEAGVELGFWKNRINFEATYYNQQATKQVLQVSVSSASGFSNYLLNAADVTNQGVDVDLKTNPIRAKDWNVNVNFNYSYNTNVVNRLYADNGLNSLIFQGDNLKTINAEVGQMFPYLKTTYWERDPNGRVVIDTADGWANRGASTRGAGNTIPKNIFGVNLNVSYKGFTLAANAEYRGDYVVYHDLGEDMAFTGSSAISTLYHRQQFVWPNSSYWDGSKYVPNTSFAVNQYIASYQSTGDLSFSRGFQGTGEAFFSSGDFWKLRELSLSYDIPVKQLFGSTKTFKGISVTAWGRNLKTWLPDDNFFNDPEFSNTNGNSTGLSTSLNTPATRQVGGTIRFVF